MDNNWLAQDWTWMNPLREKRGHNSENLLASLEQRPVPESSESDRAEVGLAKVEQGVEGVEREADAAGDERELWLKLLHGEKLTEVELQRLIKLSRAKDICTCRSNCQFILG